MEPRNMWVFKTRDWEGWLDYPIGSTVLDQALIPFSERRDRLMGLGDWRSVLRSGDIAYWMDTVDNLVYGVQSIGYRLDSDPEHGMEAIYGAYVALPPVQMRVKGQAWRTLGLKSLAAAHMEVCLLTPAEANRFSKRVMQGLQQATQVA